MSIIIMHTMCILLLLCANKQGQNDKQVAQATGLLAEGQLQKASSLLLNVVRADPKHKEARVQLANLYSQMGMPKKVEKQLRRLKKISILPQDQADSAWMLAKHLLRQKSNRYEILELLRRVLQVSPDHDNAKHWYAHQLSRSPQQKAHVKAAALLSSIRLEALTDSDPLDTLMLTGQAQERSGDLAASELAYRQITALYHERKKRQAISGRVLFRFALSYYQLCRILLLEGKIEEALESATWAHAEFPESYQIIDVLSQALVKKGRWAEAVANYRLALKKMEAWPAEWREMPERVFGSSLAWMIETKLRNMDNASVNFGQHTGQKCNIDRFSNIGGTEFLQNYAHRNKPVLFKSIDDVPVMETWHARERWTKVALGDKYGHITVTVRNSSNIAYNMEFSGLEGQNMSFSDFLASWETQNGNCSNSSHGADSGFGSPNIDPYYLFDHPHLLGKFVGLNEDFVEPKILQSEGMFALNQTERDRTLLFYCGQQQTGVTLHQHTNAWNALVHGRKRWFLLPPYALYGPTGMPMYEWLDSQFYNELRHKTFECTQEAGEILWVPTDWYHGVINLEDSVGIAVEVGYNKKMLQKLMVLNA